MLAADCHRPPKLYLYASQSRLEPALLRGEFRLLPAAAAVKPSAQILPFRPAAMRAVDAINYLTLSLAISGETSQFNVFPEADGCLMIHDAETFGERIHRAAQEMLPTWAGIDAAVSYGVPSPLGRAFSKSRQHAAETEWLFAWRPTQATAAVLPVVIRIGSIEDIAELRRKSA
jgi:hypothetical protein